MIVSIKLCRDVVNNVCIGVCNIGGHIVTGFKATRGRGGGGVGEGALKPPPQHHDYQSISRKVRPSSLQVFQKHLWLILGCYALKDFVVNSIS